MTTATDTELELIQALDFDPEMACECEGCSAEADWLGIHECCKANFGICDPHRIMAQKQIKAAKASDRGAICMYCKSWDIAYRFEPIGGH